MGTIKEITFDKEAAELLEKILRSGEKIGIACSGGADSMLLLHSLLQRFPDKKDCFTVMHFNHKVRPNAEIDENFVRKSCEELDVKFISGKPKERIAKISESSLRSARIKFFGEAAKSEGIRAITQGHNADDVAETAIMRLSRGSGTDGMCAPRPVSRRNGIVFIRPLLNLRKSEIKKILSSADLKWREDESNEECEFLRNRVRNMAIPVMEKALKVSFQHGATRSRRLLQEDADFIGKVLGEELLRLNPGSYSQSGFSGFPRILKIGKLISENAALLRRAAQLFISLHGLSKSARSGATDSFIESIMESSEKPHYLDAGEYAISYNPSDRSLEIAEKRSLDSLSKAYSVPLVMGNNILPTGSLLRLREVDLSEEDFARLSKGENDDSSRAYISVSAASGKSKNTAFYARTRIAGDSYIPLGVSSSRFVKDLFSSKKLPILKRKSNPLVCNYAGEILWSPSLPPSAKYSLLKSGMAIELTFVDKKDLF